MFDLLNEITEPAYLEDWNRISAECIRRIRRTMPDVRILVGSYHHNAVSAVKDLPAPADDRVFYSFHCYDPHTYTHQGAYWMPDDFDIGARISFRDTGVTPAFFEKLTLFRRRMPFSGSGPFMKSVRNTGLQEASGAIRRWISVSPIPAWMRSGQSC